MLHINVSTKTLFFMGIDQWVALWVFVDIMVGVQEANGSAKQLKQWIQSANGNHSYLENGNCNTSRRIFMIPMHMPRAEGGTYTGARVFQ